MCGCERDVNVMKVEKLGTVVRLEKGEVLLDEANCRSLQWDLMQHASPKSDASRILHPSGRPKCLEGPLDRYREWKQLMHLILSASKRGSF